MAGKKNDAIEIDALLVPELGDMSKVERELSKTLSKAAKPLVDSISDAKVGLNEASLRRVQRQLDSLGRDLGESFDKAMATVLSEQNKNLRSASGLRELAKADAGVAKMVKILGGYDAAAGILSRPDATNRLNKISQAFGKINEVAFTISKLPAVGDDVQKMLTKLYRGNSADGFRKLGEVQQRQVKDALAIIDLQDQAFASLKRGLSQAGLGVTAAELNKSLRERKTNAQRLGQVTSPQAMQRAIKAEQKAIRAREVTQERLRATAARTMAISERKDQVLKRTGGISGLRDRNDISAVRAGLNRDYNLAVQQLALDARGKGGKNSAAYKATTGQINEINGLRTQLHALVNDQQRVAAEQIRAGKSQAKAEQKQLDDREKHRVQQQRQDDRWTRAQADHEDQRRTQRQRADDKWTRAQADHEDQQRERQQRGDSAWQRLQATFEDRRRDKKLRDEERWAWEQAIFENKQRDRAAREGVVAGVELRNAAPRNRRQATAILRDAGGNLDSLEKGQIATVRPYLQDRFKARSAYAEGVGAKYGMDSPEFARAAASAQDYARALGELDNRARALRPTIGDLGQVVRSFFRYALGYGALYQMLGAVTALGKGLVDLDEQLHNIQAITLSTDSQMKTIEGSIKQVGMSTKFTLNEVAKGAQILAQAGTAPERIPAQLKATADFAAATNSSLEASADLLTSFQNVYTDISDGKTADLLTKALNLSKLQGEDLRTIVSYTAQTAEGYNISAEQLLGAVATLRNVGIKPSTIATGLRQAMLEVFSPDAKLMKALKTRYAQMGEELTDEAISARFNAFTFTDNPLTSAVGELKRIGFGGEAAPLFRRAFDVRAFNPLQALVNNFDQFNLMSGQVGVGRSASDASQIQLESLRATLENLGAAVVAFSDSVGGDMVRSLQAAAEKATDLVQVLTELDLQMKAENGVGLANAIGGGLAGGAIGALLGGKGFLNRAAGAATGAYVGGGLTQASNTEGGFGDYAIPAMAGLITVAPALMDFIGGLRGRQSEIKALAAKTKGLAGADISTTLGPALSLGAGVADFFSMLGKAKLPTGLAGAGVAGGLRIGAGLLARAIPVIGIIWTAYEILSLFSEKGANEMQAQIDRARTQADAAGDRFRSIQDKYNAGQDEINEYKIDTNGQAKASTTAASAVALKAQADNLNQASNELFGKTAEELGEAGSLLREYARRDSDQRKEDLKKINDLTGKQLSDQQAYDLSAQMEQLDKGVEGFRDSLVQIVNRSTDDLREAIAKGDTEGIEKAGRFQRVLDQMPELRQFLYGQVELDADKVAGLYVEFNKQMAAESEKGAVTAEQVLEAKVQAGALDISAAAAALGDSPAIDNAIQQIITGLVVTENNTVLALNKLSEKVRAKADELGAQASQLEAQAAEDQATADGMARNPRASAMGLDAPYLLSAERNAKAAAGLRQEEKAQRKAGDEAEAEAKRQQQQDDLARTRTRGAAAEIENRITSAKFSEEFLGTLSADQRALIQDVSNPEKRTQMVQAGEFKPQQIRTGQYRQSNTVAQLERILQANQQYGARQAEVSDRKQREGAKSSFLSDPTAQVAIAQLENERRAAERRNDLGGAQAATKKMFDLQYAEQAKAVKRAEVDMNAAKEDPKKDATAAIEKYNTEKAKLESLRGDMADKLDEYQKKVQDLDLKRRTVEVTGRRDKLKSAFDEAVDRGESDKAIKASQDYALVQAELIKLAKEELAAKGYSPEQIELEIASRKELTTTLIDQEGAQKRLTQAIIARSDFEARFAGTGPSTGNKAVDAYVQESGIGFTSKQFDNAYSRDLVIYARQVTQLKGELDKQLSTMTPGSEGARAAEQAYIEKIEEVQSKIGETSAKLQQLRNQFTDELSEGFDPTALLVGLQNSQNSLQNFGEFLRGSLISGVDSLGQALADAALNGEDLGDALEGVIHNLSNEIFTQGAKMGVNYLFQSGLKMIPGVEDGSAAAGNASSMIGQLLGVGGQSAMQAVGTAQITAGAVYVNGAVMGAPGGGTTPSIPGLPGTTPAAPGAAAPAATGEGFFSGLMDQTKGLFSSLSDGFTGLFSGLAGSLSGLLGGLFGGGGGDSGGGGMGSLLKLGLNAGMAYFSGGASAAAGAGGAAGYAGAFGFAGGGQPSRVIRGQRGGRDNLVATASVNGSMRPIRVESDEGILSRKAMKAIGGEAGLNLLNSGNVPAFAVGGAPQPGYNPGQPATTGADRLKQTVQESAAAKAEDQINIANIYSEQGFADFVSSRRGRKVIINELRKEGVL